LNELQRSFLREGPLRCGFAFKAFDESRAGSQARKELIER
jgi:hypothetical protein